MPRIVAPADDMALRVRTERSFEQRYGRAPTVYVSAPGRANLIGEHTDYNEGFVLPFAIARRCGVAAAPRDDRRVVVASADAPEDGVEFDLDSPILVGPPRWANYVRGVVAECLAEGVDPGGFDAWIESDVPSGAGLSSSAAFEVAVAGVVEVLADHGFAPVAKAELCWRAEHIYAGVPCGIMDQMAATLATTDDLLFLDCRTRRWRLVALPSHEVEIVLIDSEVPHDLGDGEYALRVEQCRQAAVLLGLASLRDADLDSIEELRRGGHELLYSRARHVVEENARTVAAVAAIEARDWPLLGNLMTESHASLRDLYEVSRPEIDALVQNLLHSGALGARMTGGGFGGCIVALVPR